VRDVQDSLSAGAYHVLVTTQNARFFGTRNVQDQGASKLLRLRNSGGLPLALRAISMVGGQAADFLLQRPAQATLAAGAEATLTVTFRPTALGLRRSTLRITTNESASDSPAEAAGADISGRQRCDRGLLRLGHRSR
jgi:hypothetical protein